MGKKSISNITWRDLILSCIYSPLIVLQLILFFFFYYNYLEIDILAYIGWIIWVLSIIFGILPIITFRKKGGVAKGQSYMKTTKLVDTGVYSIVRHPQYLAGLLLITALILVTQHWLSFIAGTIAFITFYIDTLKVDVDCIEKFGEDYKLYMKRVPKLNFLLGIYRRVKHKKVVEKNTAHENNIKTRKHTSEK